MENEVHERVKDFLFGGNACFTLLQEGTGCKKSVSVRYRIVQSKDNKNMYFVYTNPIGEKELKYHGYIFKGSFKKAKNLKFNPASYNEKAIIALQWLLVKGDNLPRIVHVLHDGKCSRCGRKLKDVESLRCGLGPECRKKVGKV